MVIISCHDIGEYSMQKTCSPEKCVEIKYMHLHLCTHHMHTYTHKHTHIAFHVILFFQKLS